MHKNVLREIAREEAKKRAAEEARAAADPNCESGICDLATKRVRSEEER